MIPNKGANSERESSGREEKISKIIYQITFQVRIKVKRGEKRVLMVEKKRKTH